MVDDEKKSMRDRVEARIREEAEKFKDAADGSGKDGPPEIDSKFIKACLYAKDLGDGLLFSVMLSGRFIYNKSAGEWLEFSGHSWMRDIRERSLAHVEDVADRYLQEAYDLVGRINEASKGQEEDKMKRLQDLQKQYYKRVAYLRTDKGRSVCLKFARTNRAHPMDVEGEVFDADPWLLACSNGVIDLRTGILRDGRPGDYILRSSPYEFSGIDRPAPHWETALVEIFDKNETLVTYIQRLFGYAITGHVTEMVLPIFWGRGRNGKGTIIETVASVLGDMARPIPTEMLLDQGNNKSSAAPTPDIMALRGLRIAFASEADEGRRFSPSRVKWLTGNDTLTGRNPHDKYPTDFAPTHTLIMLTNDRPQAPAQDFAFWERMHLTPFPLSFVIGREPIGESERAADKDLKDKLIDEASGILAWLVRGCIGWQKDGLNPPGIVTEATAQYRKDEDILGDFIDECCYRDLKTKTGATDLYERFDEWFQKNVSKKGMSQRKFGRLMSKVFERKKEGTYHYFGVGLLPGLD